jgi:HD-GYP domain-containing protein (c-di-GMP phosphodiesterase class II)
MDSKQAEMAILMERVVILAILIALLVAHLFIPQKVAFLGFYYLPILLAGYFCTKRTALLLSILALFLVVLYTVVEPGKMSSEIGERIDRLAALGPGSPERSELNQEIKDEKLKLHFTLATWGSFLLLTAIVASAMSEQKERRVQELHRAYVGVVELLSKYLELADSRSRGRSVQVAGFAAATARRMSLDEEAVENTRVAALLHDMGHKEISALILEKSAELGRESDTKIKAFSINGASIVHSVTSILEGVAPIVNAYHEHFVGGEEKPAPGTVKTEAEIIAVARAYYDMLAGSPTRKPKSPDEALQEMIAAGGKEFDSAIVQAFEKAVKENGMEVRPSKPAELD